MNHSTDRAWAASLDKTDPLAWARSEFCLPAGPDGEPQVYLVGNSLGLPTTSTRRYVDAELDRWAVLGVAGHTVGAEAWAPYHQLLTDQMARIVGAERDEVVMMNSLTVNLHLLLVSFYRPTPERHKILIEGHAFPSDHFAVESQIRQRGFDVESSLEIVRPCPGSQTLRADDLLAAIERCGPDLAMVLLPGVQYYTGQVLPMAEVTEAGHAQGALVGFDLAHAVGNVTLDLHGWGADFATWCSYKYLNGGPGGVGGCFVHARHIDDQTLPKLLGWWGTRAETRFEMATTFEPIPTVESWQLSNAPILSMAALRASLDVFDRGGGMPALRRKSEQQLAYLDFLLDEVLGSRVTSITPRPLAERGCQYSLRITAPGLADQGCGQAVHAQLEARGVACDWRHPDVIRVAPVPLYNSFTDLWRFVQVLDEVIDAVTGEVAA